MDKVYSLEYFDVDKKDWKRLSFWKNLQKAYLGVADFAKPKVSYAKVYKDLKASEDEATCTFDAEALPTTPAAARIAGTVKLKISKHPVL
jgi:hypothetical protein